VVKVIVLPSAIKFPYLLRKLSRTIPNEIIEATKAAIAKAVPAPSVSTTVLAPPPTEAVRKAGAAGAVTWPATFAAAGTTPAGPPGRFIGLAG
jgi:hypothetical protein